MRPTKSKKALLIGINDYHKFPLRGCENDAKAMDIMLKHNGNGDPNFSTKIEFNLSSKRLRAFIVQLLAGDADHALLYFSGHGYVDDTGGFLVSRDFTDEDMGVSMSWLTREINKSDIEEITLILDCCHAGSAANLRPEDGKEEVAELRKNVTVLAASTQEGKANEKLGQGVFTNILLQGLNGAAADLAGHVTAASLYSMADSILSPWQQRPVFKSFVTQMSPLRYCLPQTPKGQMRQLVKPDFFEDTERVLQLSPDDISADRESQPETVRFFSLLLAFHQAGLIECPNRQSLFEAALHSSTCQLTLHGRYVHQLITSKRF